METNNYPVIDQFFAAQVSANESEATAEQGLPKNFKGMLEYHGFKIRVQRPTSYTWEQNTNPAITSDPNHAIYVQQLELQKRISDQLKDMRADVKRTAEKLAQAHPDSESIKRGFTIAIMA